MRTVRWRRHLLGVVVCGTLFAAEPLRGQVPEWSLREDVTIGSADDPVHGLTPVGGVLVDADHVYVLQPQDGRISVFTRAGEFARTLGRRGEGPGELMHPTWMGWHGSRLWVTDYRLRRITLFDVATGAAEAIAYRAPRGSMSGMIPRAVLANALFVGYPEFSIRALARRAAGGRPIIASDADGALRDTLAVLARDQQTGEISAGLGSGIELLLSPLPERGLIAFAPDGSSAVIVDRTSWDGVGLAEFEVTRIGVRGDTIFARRVAYTPRRVPDDFFDNEIQDAIVRPDVVNRRAYERALREFYGLRRYFPPVTRVVMGSDRTTWLAGIEDEGRERAWLVLDAVGSTIGRLRLPASSRVLSASATECWVAETDALDIPYVVRYEIVR